MICVCESEIIPYHLHLYACQAYTAIRLNERTLEAAGITTMRQLFKLRDVERKQPAQCWLGCLSPEDLPTRAV